jgi:hypothetical protein
MPRPTLRLIPFVMMICLLAAMSSPARAAHNDAPPLIDSTIDSVSLFKHGLAVVRRTLELPGPGVFDITDLPEPVHGTFWVESSATCTIRMTTREVQTPTGDDPLDMSPRSLAGCTVRVRFKHEHLPTVTGIVRAPATSDDAFSRSYSTLRPEIRWWWSGYSEYNYYNYDRTPNNEPGTQSLAVQTDDGEVLVDFSTVAQIEVLHRPHTAPRRQSVMRMTVADDAAPRHARQSTQAEPIAVEIVYLAKGASWAPSYAVDITDPKTMAFRQKAVIRNELEDWDNAEIFLITGYPSIEFGNVLSPLSPTTSLSTFFAALASTQRSSRNRSPDVMSQLVVTSNDPSAAMSTAGSTVDPSLTGVDLQYHGIGRWSLARGESMLVATAREAGPYSRVVHWEVPDFRNEYGKFDWRPYRHHDDKPDPNSVAWDAMRFANPMDRPMTTAPMVVMEDGLVKGQQTATWAAPGQSMIVRINKALSVLVDAQEMQIEGTQRDWGGWYVKVDVKGELHLHNQRAETITMVIQRDFLGELLDADDDPVRDLLQHRAYWSWRNPQTRLTWTIDLAPGEQREITYRYTAIVPK